MQTIRATITSVELSALPEPDPVTGTVWARETEPNTYVADVPAGFSIRTVVLPPTWTEESSYTLSIGDASA